MEKIPQIVSERLKAASSAVDHTDPDVLTAFSEHSLRKAERAAVVEHLARCGECREILALALPVSEQLPETIHPANEGWLTWPAIRWAFVAAGIIAIASFGVVKYEHRPSITGYLAPHYKSTAKEAKNLSPSSTSSVSPEDHDKAPAAAPASTLTDRKDLSPSNGAPTPSAEMAAPSGAQVRSKSMTGAALPHGPRVQWQQNTNVQQQIAQAPVKQLRAIPLPSASSSPSPEAVDAESAQAALSANVDSSAVQNKIDQQALQNGHTDTRVERSKPAATTVANVPTLPFPVPARAQLIRQSAQAGAVPNPSVRWTITAAGRLQRSLDQGATWQDIDVNNPPGAAGASLDLMSPPSKARELTANSLAKKDASAPLVFRAVASNGPDVWAGASGGWLYHSTDAGTHWTRVVPSTSGVSLTGDVVSLEFVDPQQGRVVTSTPEVWTTSDAGQSWQKQ